MPAQISACAQRMAARRSVFAKPRYLQRAVPSLLDSPVAATDDTFVIGTVNSSRGPRKTSASAITK